MPIRKTRIKHGVDPGISYSSHYGLWDAAVAAHLDLHRLWRGEYDGSFLAHVVAWHNGHKAIEQHGQDAAIDKAEKDARKARNK